MGRPMAVSNNVKVSSNCSKQGTGVYQILRTMNFATLSKNQGVTNTRRAKVASVPVRKKRRLQ